MLDVRRFTVGSAGIALLGALYACGSGSSQEPPASAPGTPGSQAQADTSGGHHNHHTPPPAAFDACKGKQLGEACSLSWREEEIHGKCEAPPPGSTESGPACRPEGGRFRRHHGPPPEKVFAACDGKGAGDECSVATDHGNANGSCMMPKHDAGAARLLCAAARAHKGEGK